MRSLDEMFAITPHKSELNEELVNSEKTNIVPGDNWSFDKNALTIHNNLFWKGSLAEILI